MSNIARIWSGSVDADKADEYLEYMAKTGVAGITETPGNLGVLVLKRVQNGEAEFTFVSFWKSLETIAAFAGPDINRAVYYPEDKKFLKKLEPEVQHFEIAASRGVQLLGEKNQK
jgi:heme-degrading monooxygenase HmoA